MAFRWRAVEGPLIMVFGSSHPSPTKKTLLKLDPTDKLSGSAHVLGSSTTAATLNITHLGPELQCLLKSSLTVRRHCNSGTWSLVNYKWYAPNGRRVLGGRQYSLDVLEGVCLLTKSVKNAFSSAVSMLTGWILLPIL